jgi:hypothetical protein
VSPPPEEESRAREIAGLLAKGPLRFEELASSIHTSPKEVAERWEQIAPHLDAGMRRTWEPVIRHWRAMELGIGKEEYLAERRRKEELAAVLWSRVLDPRTKGEARRLLADAEKGILAGYGGAVLDFGTFVGVPADPEAPPPEGLRTVETPALPGVRLVGNPIFPPISMAYRALHRSWKAYRMKDLVAGRLRLLLELSPRVESAAGLEMKELVERAGMNETLLSLVLPALGLEWTEAKNEPEAWARDMALLFAAESITGNALRAILLADGPLPHESVAEHEALILEMYGVLR